ncbi:aminoacetone oxidase family FAD-binding enzyme [uncultured Ruminococcus sp.]|uniref:aminoacetone oxidase family FAD-binding enzyme n=1 Tax=uncultured Ruminococcus sp. TaxID=165186 RepID=UPI002609C271|nr:aminoacetone oxidase family FAD-binding enzyme [uncultured Ruminococcus sp.]
MMRTDILVIGGGASGITAACEAKKCYPRADVMICERLDRIGKKLLSTGNGKCNLSNRELSPDNYHGSFDALIFIEKTPSAEEFFAEYGILCAADEQGRMYPYSGSAASVLNALRLRLKGLGVTEVCGFEVRDIVQAKSGFSVASADGRSIECRRLIIAAGGYAAPNMGTDGSVLRLLRGKGVKLGKIVPAVAPLRVDSEKVKGLKGVRAKCVVRAFADGRLLREEKGEVQFTENSLSGICVFNMAYLFGKYDKSLRLELDLAPDMSEQEVADYIRSAAQMRSDCELNELLTGMFCKNLAVYLVKTTLKRPMTETVSGVTASDVKVLTNRIKRCSFDVSGASPWQNAQATLGGIAADEVTDALELRRFKGVYLCGEILDTVGDCGGYNLQWAWSSGIIAGRNCALSLKGELK